METNKDNSKYIVIYHKKHWGGMTLKRLRIGYHKGSLFYEWENGGYVITRPILRIKK